MFGTEHDFNTYANKIDREPAVEEDSAGLVADRSVAVEQAAVDERIHGRADLRAQF